jgi:N-acetylmuramoyl-L-alanine amidase
LKALSLVFGLALLALQPRPTLAQSTASPRPYVVTIAPGHGGDHPGAVYPPNTDRPSIEEKNLTLPIALKLRDRLQAEDVQVIMTRTTDVTTTAQQRASTAEKAGADVFVAVHINSWYPDGTVRGAETQYFSDPKIADDVADGLALSLQDFQETVRTSKNREEDNILSMPGVIVEAAYLSNSADRALLQTAAYQDAIADGIYQGILRYAPQIKDLKTQIETYKASHPKTAPAAEPAPNQRSRVPGWLPPASVGLGLGLTLLALRNRARRRHRVRRYRPNTVVRYR